MKYTFKDITVPEIYDSALVLFVVGQYNIFNNIAIDEVKDRCKPKQMAHIDKSLLADFDFSDDELQGVTVSNIVDFNTFTSVINSVSMSGKWYTSIDYSFASQKQKTWINNYLKEPSENGRLVVYCTEYKDYKLLLRNKTIINSQNIHLIQLGFPNKNTLESIVYALFNKRGLSIEQRAVELFVMRMSNSYDDYSEIVEKIIVESVPKDDSGEKAPGWRYTVTYDDTFRAMKGIENFVLDDFIDRLLIPLTSDKVTGRNKIYKMLGALLEEMGPMELVKKLKFKIDDYIEFRMAINKGIIPIMVRFSVPEAKERLGETCKITRYSDYTFRKMAHIAANTSLKDWSYMKMILSNIPNKYDQTSYEKALYALINRSVFNSSRLNNNIGVENILYKEIDELNKIEFKDIDEIVV